MPKHNRILCPVDLSENSFAAIELATTLAKEHGAKIHFFHVSSLWEPGSSKRLQEYATKIIEDDKKKLYRIRPTDSSVEFEHQFVHGNAGPELVKATKKADFVVMSTHGRSGIARLIMGSVANHVLRNAQCSVILVKGKKIAKDDSETSTQSAESQIYVTEVMHQVPPVHTFETMDSVLKGLSKARETAAPVVNGSGECIGILTTTDIEKFKSLQQRFDEKDESVVDEIFEVDQFGLRRTKNYNFDQVERHMTKEVVGLQDTDSVQTAIDLFEANPDIHHLVVLNEDNCALGVVDAADVSGAKIAKQENTST